MAAELGISTHKLSHELHADPAAPRRRLQHHGTVCSTWYEPREIRAWWRARFCRHGVSLSRTCGECLDE